jgi:RNA polymerase sigma-70 factor (ECF subfamily)
MVAAWNAAAAPDDVLVRAAQEDPGSEEARRAACVLLSRYRERVYAWCYERLRDPERALDIAQEVLLSAYRHLDSFEPRARFSTWLYAITRNRCISELRRPGLLYDDEADPDTLRDPAQDPAQQLAEKMTQEALLELIRAHLDPLEQEVLWLRCVEQMPLERINASLDLQQASGARGILQRARRHLREALASSGRGAEVMP